MQPICWHGSYSLLNLFFYLRFWCDYVALNTGGSRNLLGDEESKKCLSCMVCDEKRRSTNVLICNNKTFAGELL